MNELTQEIRDYYKKKFNFDDIVFVVPDHYWDAGKIITTRAGQTKEFLMSDLLISRGFDGIDDMLKYVDENWDLHD